MDHPNSFKVNPDSFKVNPNPLISCLVRIELSGRVKIVNPTIGHYTGRGRGRG